MHTPSQPWPDPSGSAGVPSRLGWIGDAAYIACSWTWCIGMFLPAMLIRDYGLASFLAFALPNCIGAAAMAWWLRSSEQSRAFVIQHARAIRAFTYVTIAFQWFFAAWLLRGLGLSAWTLAAIALGVVVFMSLPVRIEHDRPRRIVSMLVWLVSVALLVAWALGLGQATSTASSVATLEGMPTPLLSDSTFAHHPGTHLAPLAAVCLLGFALCPLLDLTFHHTLQTSPRPKPTFALGFLLLFPALILGTLLYGADLVRLAASNQTNIAPAGLAWLIIFHIAAQLAFTIAAHERSIQRRVAGLALASSSPAPLAIPVATITGVVLALVATLIGPSLASTAPALTPATSLPTLTNSEFIYRAFMMFYGLLAPLYVIGCVFSWRKAHHSQPASAPSPAKIIALACVALPAAVAYHVGFIERYSAALWLGIAIVLLGGIAVSLFVKGNSPRVGT